MASEREERLAKNEALFRAVNERMAEWEERHRGHPEDHYMCECGRLGCHDRIPLTYREYERVRSRSDQFVVVDGHEASDVEHVVDRLDGGVVVRKDPNVSEITESTDPRRRND